MALPAQRFFAVSALALALGGAVAAAPAQASVKICIYHAKTGEYTTKNVADSDIAAYASNPHDLVPAPTEGCPVKGTKKSSVQNTPPTKTRTTSTPPKATAGSGSLPRTGGSPLVVFAAGFGIALAGLGLRLRSRALRF